MSPQKFISLLQYPHVSEKPGMVEVEHLLMKYPYCQSLHVFKAKMYRLAEHPDAEKALNKAATYTCDRTFLYETMNQLHDSPIKALEMPAGLMDLTTAFEGEILTLKDPAELAIATFEILEEKSRSGSISSNYSDSSSNNSKMRDSDNVNESDNIEKATPPTTHLPPPLVPLSDLVVKKRNDAQPNNPQPATQMEALEIPSLSEEEPLAIEIEEPPLEIPSLSLYDDPKVTQAPLPDPKPETPQPTTQQHDNTTTQQHNNTTTQQHNNTTTQQHNNTTTQQHDNTATQQPDNTATQQHNPPQDDFSKWLSSLKAPKAGKQPTKPTSQPANPPTRNPQPRNPQPTNSPTRNPPTRNPQPTNSPTRNPQPATHQPANPQPATHQPANPQPATHQPANPQPATHQPATRNAAKKEKQKSKEGVIEDKGKRLRKLIKRSVTQSDEAVSETLAKVLVIQGKKKKARWMYAQLSLKFPEKSAYFAAQIEKLKK